MTVSQYPFVYLCLFASILACRVLPMFVLKGRTLTPRVERAFSLIPSAAFAALVANDLLQPDILIHDTPLGLIPLLAAIPVVICARKTNSLIWSALIGMISYALLSYAITTYLPM